ncbi:MAG: DUF3160 domain-containing protein [bacterium]
MPKEPGRNPTDGRYSGRAYLRRVAVLLLIALLAGGCTNPSAPDSRTLQEKISLVTTVPAGDFAAFAAEPVQIDPAVPDYRTAANLSNITNPNMFQLSDAARKQLCSNGFVVVPGSEPEFFTLYEMNRYQAVPLFITTDSLLHNYHLFFAHLLRVTEKEKLAPGLAELSRVMLTQAEKDWTALRGTAWENAAKRNLGFFAVAGKILDPGLAVPAAVAAEVAGEIALIESHEEIALSPVMNLGQTPDRLEGFKEDYTQYIPRGHYTSSDQLKAYFKAMMWYGRPTFRLKEEDETRSAVLITLALARDENLALWEQIYAPTCFFVGRSDDITVHQLGELLADVYDGSIDLQTLLENGERWETFLAAVAELPPPAVNSIPIFDETIQPDREREIHGFRFLGQRFTLDAAIFQRLVYRDVKENAGGERRMLPKSLDLPAALGSRTAYSLLENMGETGYKNYPETMTALQNFIAGLDEATWTQNLYWGWLHTLRPLLEEKPAGYPSFMRNAAWTRKELNTFLGSWTELKHDTILYAKQVYAEAGGGGEDVDDRGYVEPNPDLYARLAALARMTREGLSERDLLGATDRASLERLEQLALHLKHISEKELNNAPLTEEEYDIIRSYGVSLEHFWLEALRDEGVDHPSAAYDRPAALVTDVATDIAHGLVLEEGTGYISRIYAVVPVEGSLRIAVGGVYSYYEFPWPFTDRLMDEKWHGMLEAGEAPPPPEWTTQFTAK